MLFALSSFAIYLDLYTSVGRHFWAWFAGIVLASLIGAVVTAWISPSPWPRVTYLILGLAALYGLAIIQAAGSDGHPDHRLTWLAPSHALAAALVFIAVPGPLSASIPWRKAMILVAIAFAGMLSWGLIGRAGENAALLHSAELHKRAAAQLWLPRIFTKAPAVKWSEPRLSEHEYDVIGRLSNPRGSMSVYGKQQFGTFALSIRPSHPFPTYVNEEASHYLRRLAPYLRKEGCSEELVGGLAMSTRPNTAVSQLNNVPVDPADPGKGTHPVTVNISAQQDSLSFSIDWTGAGNN